MFIPRTDTRSIAHAFEQPLRALRCRGAGRGRTKFQNHTEQLSEHRIARQMRLLIAACEFGPTACIIQSSQIVIPAPTNSIFSRVFVPERRINGDPLRIPPAPTQLHAALAEQESESSARSKVI